MCNFYFRVCNKSSQLKEKEIQFQFQLTNFIYNTVFPVLFLFYFKFSLMSSLMFLKNFAEFYYN